MCGIAGWYRRGGRPVAAEAVATQCDRLIHRGPDDAGLFVETFDDATGQYALVSTRLQIMEEMTYTSAQDPVNGGDISFVNVTQDTSTLDFDLHLLNQKEGYDVIVASVRLKRTQHGAQEGVGGTLNVGGGGAFGVACTKVEG